MASRAMLSLRRGRELSRSTLLSVLQSELIPLLSPFIRTTSQWLLDASVTHDDSDAICSGQGRPADEPPASTSTGAPHSLDSDSELAAPSRLSLLLERRCLLPSCGRRKRPGLRPPVLGLLEGLLFRLREGADLRLEAGEAAGRNTVKGLFHYRTMSCRCRRSSYEIFC